MGRRCEERGGRGRGRDSGLGGGRCSRDEKSRAIQHKAMTLKSEEKEEGREAKGEYTQSRCKNLTRDERERREGTQARGKNPTRDRDR